MSVGNYRTESMRPSSQEDTLISQKTRYNNTLLRYILYVVLFKNIWFNLCHTKFI